MHVSVLLYRLQGRNLVSDSKTLTRCPCRSAIPVATAVLAISIEGKTPTRAEFASLLVLTAGVIVAVWEGLRGSVLGIAFACLGALCLPLRLEVCTIRVSCAIHGPIMSCCRPCAQEHRQPRPLRAKASGGQACLVCRLRDFYLIVPAGMLSNAAMMSTSGRVLSEKMDVVRLTFYTAPVSCLALTPFFLWREVGRTRC